MNGREGPRTVTLSQQLIMESDFDSPNIRDIPTRNTAGPWDSSSLRTASGRTLFDIIQQDDNWKPVKDRLRLQRVGAAFSGGPSPSNAAPVPQYPTETAPPLSNSANGPRMGTCGNTSLRRNSTLARTMTRSCSVQPSSITSFRNAPAVGEIVITEITDVTDETENEHKHRDKKVEEQAKGSPGLGGMSLMALLEQTDTQWGDNGPEETGELNFDGDDGDFDDDDEADGEGLYHVCCVCMVRHKGAAFIPCGHTFCRLCSRELWVSHGNCPLCNGFIQEILDIF